MLKHKAGDTVRIQTQEWMDAQEKDEDGGIDLGESDKLVDTMFSYAGKEAKITRVDEERSLYRLDIDGGEWGWTDGMFDPDYRPEDEPLSAEEAIRAMMEGGETLYNTAGDRSFRWDGYGFRDLSKRVDRDGAYIVTYNGMGFRRTMPVKRTRPMTRWEILAWATGEESHGWVVRSKNVDDSWAPPQSFGYGLDRHGYERARLLDDHSGIDESTIQGFETEE